MNNGKNGQGTHRTKISTDILAENTPNIPICLKLNSMPCIRCQCMLDLSIHLLSAPILVQWVPCPFFPLFNHYFYKKLSLYILIPNIYLGFGFKFKPQRIRDLANWKPTAASFWQVSDRSCDLAVSKILEMSVRSNLATNWIAIAIVYNHVWNSRTLFTCMLLLLWPGSFT